VWCRQPIETTQSSDPSANGKARAPARTQFDPGVVALAKATAFGAMSSATSWPDFVPSRRVTEP